MFKKDYQESSISVEHLRYIMQSLPLPRSARIRRRGIEFDLNWNLTLDMFIRDEPYCG